MHKVRVTVDGRVAHEVLLDRELVLGRKAPADLVVADGQISSRHLSLRPGDDGAVLRDLGSTNGTRIGAGDRIEADRDFEIRPGQQILAGPAILEIVSSGGPESSDSGFAKTEKTVAITGNSMQSVLVNIARFQAAKPRLVVALEHGRKVVALEELESVVGRSSADAKVVVDHQSVSSRHAKIRFADGQFQISDLGSANGTFLDGIRISGESPLPPQSAVTLGTVECLFVARPPETTGAVGAGDPISDVLADHAVRLGKATQQQARDAVAEHRASGRTLGEVLVERGVFTPKEWADLWKQRELLRTLGSAAPAAGGGGASKTGWIVALVALAAAAFVAWRSGLFGAK
ncbi:MAG: hypothetical protein HMLKMBBP_03995 [Planctomycetes bacterium]|nr:hypothetical protein [Planctomycetota bacterium]